MPKEKISFQDKINHNIKIAMTSWVNGSVLEADSVDLTITCHSNRYLSFSNSFVFRSSRTDVVNDYITLDMSTGERVYLDDLVEINEEFAEYIQRINHNEWIARNASTHLQVEELNIFII